MKCINCDTYLERKLEIPKDQVFFLGDVCHIDQFIQSLMCFDLLKHFFFLSGEIPSVSEGTVSATGCITRDRECCISELPIKVRNCSAFVLYHLDPTPGCNMGYCVGEGVPCPAGLTSESGYTPCDCKFTQALVRCDC
jgi:hypothetical protein